MITCTKSSRARPEQRRPSEHRRAWASVGDDKAVNFFDFLFFYQTLNITIVQENRDQIKRAPSNSQRTIFRRHSGFFIWMETDHRRGVAQDNCMQMIGVYDSNSDGLLDFEEYNLRKWRPWILWNYIIRTLLFFPRLLAWMNLLHCVYVHTYVTMYIVYFVYKVRAFVVAFLKK